LDCDFAIVVEDIKIWKVLHNAADEDNFQGNLRRLDEWSRRWLLPVNSNKCTLLRLGNKTQVTDMRRNYMNGIPFRAAETKKGLGV
uniref:Reverse transcriptase domain-containing protein n=1 Tax=Schistocephalus solidus TaxID=70667 RepID=A0A183TTZ8_SCHSO